MGGLQPVRSYRELEIMAEQSGMKLNTREGEQGLKWLNETFFGNALDKGRYSRHHYRWLKYYGDKLQPYLREGFKITPSGKGFHPGDKSKYYLMPSELSARMAEIRFLRNIENPTSREISLLRDMEQ